MTSLLLVVLIVLLYLVACIIKVKQQDANFEHINKKDWFIGKLPSPILFIRIINTLGLGCGASCFSSTMLFIINRALVKPALEESLKVMQAAEEKRTLPSVLVDKQARDAMKKRVQENYNDIYNSKTMNVFSKMLNAAAAYECLTNHQALLKLGMSLEVSKEEVKEPVFIVSFPRTGTTILHRTMSLDRKRFRNFDLCDMIVPLPDPVPRWDMEARKAKAKVADNLLGQMKSIFPGYAESLETMHGFRAGEADEDLGWYNTGIGHLFMDALIKLYPENRSKPQGISPLESKDFAIYRYEWLSMIMRIYQHIDKTEWEKRKADARTTDEESPLSSEQYVGPCPTENLPWLMKDPNHSAYLPELLKVFPDAKLVFSHRAPGEIVPSMAKLFVILTSVEFVPYAPGTSSKEWGVEANMRMTHYCDGLVEFTKSQDPDSPYALQKVGKVLESSGSKRRIDLSFLDLVQDVPGAISIIYKQFYPNQPIPSEEAMEAFKVYLEKNKRENFGNQRRSLEDFHLTKDDVAFTEYHSVFLDAKE